MKRVWLYGTGLVGLIVLGYLAFSLGSSMQPKPELAGTSLQTPVDVSQVSLDHVSGKKIALGEYKGKVSLVFFGFTNCPDVCPITLAQLANMYKNLNEPEELQVIMITVDPQVDTPEVLQNYVDNFHTDFVALSGDNSSVAEAASSFFASYRGIGTENFFHTDVVFVLDRKGQMRLIYGQEDMEALEGNVETILAQANW